MTEEIGEDPIKFHRELVQAIRIKSEEETNKPDKPWDSYRSNAKDYCRYIGVDEDFLGRFVSSRQKTGNRIYALDLLANTHALRDLDVDGIAVGLTDTRDQSEKNIDAGKRTILALNLLQKKHAWHKIHQYMVNNGHQGFDLIIQRGVAGLGLISKSSAGRLSHLREAYKLLSPNGLILTEIRQIDRNLIEQNNFVDFWNSFSGIKVELHDHGLVIIKSPEAPKDLPIKTIPNILKTIRYYTRG